MRTHAAFEHWSAGVTLPAIVCAALALSGGNALAQTPQELKRLTLEHNAYSELRAGPVAAYSTSDVRVAWHSSAGVELAVLGQNLHQPHHVEWRDGAAATELQRAAIITVTLRH